MGQTLDMALKIYTSVEKGLKLKDRKFWGVTPTLVEEYSNEYSWFTGQQGIWDIIS